MNGREIPTSPASAIGIFSPSLILSISDEKYSSGSFSRVSFGGASPSSPKIFNIVLDCSGVEEKVLLGDVDINLDGEVNALAQEMMAAMRRRELIIEERYMVK